MTIPTPPAGARLTDEQIADLSADTCSGCGGPYRFDTSVPSVQWNAVVRAAGLAEYLCLTCIVRAFVAAGVSFHATLSGSDFNGVPIEVRINGADSGALRAVEDENNRLRQEPALRAAAPWDNCACAHVRWHVVDGLNVCECGAPKGRAAARVSAQPHDKGIYENRVQDCPTCAGEGVVARVSGPTREAVEALNRYWTVESSDGGISASLGISPKGEWLRRKDVLALYTEPVPQPAAQPTDAQHLALFDELASMPPAAQEVAPLQALVEKWMDVATGPSVDDTWANAFGVCANDLAEALSRVAPPAPSDGALADEVVEHAFAGDNYTFLEHAKTCAKNAVLAALQRAREGAQS